MSMRREILAVVGDEPLTAEQIVERVGVFGTPWKRTSLMEGIRRLRKSGHLVASGDRPQVYRRAHPTVVPEITERHLALRTKED